ESLTQKLPPPMVNSHGPLSEPTPAVQPWPWNGSCRRQAQQLPARLHRLLGLPCGSPPLALSSKYLARSDQSRRVAAATHGRHPEPHTSFPCTSSALSTA